MPGDLVQRPEVVFVVRQIVDEILVAVWHHIVEAVEYEGPVGMDRNLATSSLASSILFASSGLIYFCPI